MFALWQTAVRAEGFSIVFVGVGVLFALLALFFVCLGLSFLCFWKEAKSLEENDLSPRF